MKNSLETPYHIYNDVTETPLPIQDLFKRAFEAREVAYAPYSKFKVGSALLLENFEMVVGTNQENASYPVGICAERVALSSSSSQYPNIPIQSIAIVAGKDLNNENAIAPCGICRQTLLEYENRQDKPIEIYFMGTQGKVIYVDSVKRLLPFSFDGSALI